MFLKKCPFCGGEVGFLVLDDEFNIHTEEGYEEDPWSGLQYALNHPVSKNKDCLIANADGEIFGRYGYDTKEEAAEAWNKQTSVPQGVLDQVRWERDVALKQLSDIGKSLGEKMDDIVEAINAKSVENR